MVVAQEPSTGAAACFAVLLFSTVGYGVCWLYERTYRGSAAAHRRGEYEGYRAHALPRFGEVGKRVFPWLGSASIMAAIILSVMD